MVRLAGLAVVVLAISVGGCGAAVAGAPAQGTGAAAGVLAPAQGANAPTLLTFATDSDDEALRVVAAQFRARGWNASEDTGVRQVVLTSPGAKKYGVRASMQGKGVIDRFVIFKAFALKPAAKDSPKVAELVAKLTNDVSGVAYQLTTDGAIVCVTWVYFIDTVDLRLVTAAMELLDEVATPIIAKKTPELLQMLQ
jgi:hypothetical protein